MTTFVMAKSLLLLAGLLPRPALAVACFLPVFYLVANHLSGEPQHAESNTGTQIVHPLDANVRVLAACSSVGPPDHFPLTG
jgi:hypothetical protein